MQLKAGIDSASAPALPPSPEAGRARPARSRWPIDPAGGRAYWLGLAAVCLAVVSGMATSLILTGLTGVVPTGDVVLLVILANVLLVLPLVAAIAWQVVSLWRARRERVAGARLHIRVVGLFSVIALLPAILLAGFAAATLNRTLDQVFAKRVKTIVANSVDVARAYVEEHGKTMRGDVAAMANDLDAAAGLTRTAPDEFRKLMTTQAGLRDLSQAYLVDGRGLVLVAIDKANPEGYLAPPAGALEDARSGQTIVIAPGRSNRLGALQKLQSFEDTYLFVLRPVDATVLRHLRMTEEGVARYSELERVKQGIKVASGIMYVVIALTLLLASIWTGMWFADRLVEPIRRLIGASQRISEGDLSVEVPVKRGEGDLKLLARTFNRMTSQLKSQRDALVDANAQLLERRRFIEAVLSGVTAGVLGVDSRGVVRLANRSAEQLLATSSETLVGRPLEEVVPEFAKLAAGAEEASRRGAAQTQVTLPVNGTDRTFSVRVTRERAGDDAEGLVVTFDDITELVTAQRTSAWADIARRIAHEIKNPLTPIQLSAERLKRKYGAVITEDRDVFDKCITTIVRQVGDIGRMVDEFSSFARMPKPQMELEDLGRVVKEAVVLYEIGGDVEVRVEAPAEPITMLCDRRLLSQLLTNLIKNAGEAIQALAESKEAPPGYRGRILTRVSASSREAVIEVIDNGIGLPRKDRGRLIEPYVTTRAKGTGLGLAIVQKIVEQHGGNLSLEDAPAIGEAPARGAMIRVVLPILAQRPQPTDGGSPRQEGAVIGAGRPAA